MTKEAETAYRLECLTLAVKVSETGEPHSRIIEKAEAFEKYLIKKGGDAE